MAYADYAFYKGTYKGSKLSEDAFEQLSERATDYIDSRTDYILHKSGIPPDMELRIKKSLLCACGNAPHLRIGRNEAVRKCGRLFGILCSNGAADNGTAA
nr:MAG TPA: Head Tail Connector Protein [Caudoviricetes sp.]